MTVEHLTELYGLPVVPFPGPDEDRPLPGPDACAWRLSADPYGDSGEDFEGLWERFRTAVDPTRVRALAFGMWGEPYENDSTVLVEALLAEKERFTALRSVFVGDIVREENEISWIEQSDVTPLLAAFPELEELGVRGGTGLEFPPTRHERLRRLVIETGGLPAAVVRGVGASELPALEHLDLWLGVPEYGGDSTVEDLAALLSGASLPSLRHLGLRDSEQQDAICAAVAASPLVPRLRSLDLSLGLLTDAGAAALLAGQPLDHLEKLDLHHNYLSAATAERVRRALEPSGVAVDVTERGNAYRHDGVEHRYCAVTE